MKNVLVTGGAGFIGSNFVRYLITHRPGVNIVNLDLLTYAGNLENLSGLSKNPQHIFVQGDIGDTHLVENIIREHKIDTIANFAAESHVDRSIFDSSPFITTNVMGSVSLMDAALKAWTAGHPSRFHHVSTDEVYGSLRADESPFTEETPYQPNSPYAASKASSDHFVRAYIHTHDLPATISNCSNNYGPYQFPEKLIPLMVTNALQGKPLPIYGDGQQIRDWLYVEDHCEAILMILENGELGETYNIGGDNQITNLELVKEICAVLDDLLTKSAHKPHDTLIEFIEDRPGHDWRYAMDIEKIKRELGWQPKVDLQQGLRRTIQWYLDHPEWVDSISQQGSYAEWVAKNYEQRNNLQ